jgi:hypothetical protein
MLHAAQRIAFALPLAPAETGRKQELPGFLGFSIDWMSV